MSSPNLPKILVVNPNSSESVTISIGKAVYNTKDSKTRPLGRTPFTSTISLFAAPAAAPQSIDDTVTSVISAAISWSSLLEEVGNYDAFLIACYSDHPLIHMLKEVTEKPVMGILEASVTHALLLGKRFGVVTTGPAWVPLLTQAINNFIGSTSSTRFGGVVSTGLGVLELHPKASNERSEGRVRRKMGEAARVLVVEQRVDVICLGCAGMEGLEGAIRDGISDLPNGDKIHVVDGVVAGVELLTGILRARQPSGQL